MEIQIWKLKIPCFQWNFSHIHTKQLVKAQLKQTLSNLSAIQYASSSTFIWKFLFPSRVHFSTIPISEFELLKHR